MNEAQTNLNDDILESRQWQYYTVKNFANKNKELGSWPDSEWSIWALRAGCPQNGFGKAFVTVGRRVLIDEEKFRQAVIKNNK